MKTQEEPYKLENRAMEKRKGGEQVPVEISVAKFQRSGGWFPSGGRNMVKLKVGDVISQVHGEKEVLRVALTKVREEMLEGYVLLSDYETWGHENVGETFRMAPDYYYSGWSNNKTTFVYWRVV